MTIAFQEFALRPELLKVLEEIGFKNATPIQAQCIPLLLKGGDVVGQSQTGSGKTFAFGLPLIQQVDLAKRDVQALILCPTRELCAQVVRELKKLGRHFQGLRVQILCGGQPIRPQLIGLEDGPHIVVGTPGRVLDHLGRASLSLKHLQTVVLDEADRMLDMGFLNDVEDILRATPKKKQTVLFSATFPETIADLSRHFQNSPQHIIIEAQQEQKPSIDHLYCETTPDNKAFTLMQWLFETKPKSVLVFCRMKADTVDLAEFLANDNITAAALHGDLEQRDRDKVLARFRNHSLRVLVATDVVARGIDVEQLDAVVNFDLPSTGEDYVHRVGRTGRAGAKGTALNVVTERQLGKLEFLEGDVGIKFKKIEAPKITEEEISKETLLADMETLSISGGRKQKVRPGDILGALTGEAVGLSSQDVGKIEIHDLISFVAVARPVARIALKKLQGSQIKARRFYVELVN